jgi:Fe-S-cluster containining protein
MPGQAEKVATHLNIPLKELFDTKLMVDWHENTGEDGNVFLLSPAVVDGTPGSEFPGDPRGQCVFLTEDRKCGIYEVRPFECSEYIHETPRSEVDERHDSIGSAWAQHQGQIIELLGREPVSETYQGGLFGGLFSSFNF